MPHITTYGGSYFSVQPKKDSFGSFEPRQAKLQEASMNDQLIGRKALKWSELFDVGLSLRKADVFIKLGNIKGEFQADELTGNFNALNETTNVRPNKGESISIIHPQFSEADGSGDSLTGKGSPVNSWRNADPSPFEDRMALDFDSNDFHVCPNIHLSTEAPSMSMHQGAMNSVLAKDLAGNFLDEAGNISETFEPMEARTSFARSFNVLKSDLPFEGVHYQPAPGMNSFGESRNPVFEAGACNGYDCTNAGSCSDPAILKAMVGSTSGLGGMSF